MAFSCQLVDLPIFTKVQITIFIFQCLVSIFDTGYFCSFKAKVIRVLFQLDSPKSEYRNSRYVRNNSDYTMINTDAGNGLAHSPSWSKYFSYLESEFGDTYKIGMVLLEVYFT